MSNFLKDAFESMQEFKRKHKSDFVMPANILRMSPDERIDIFSKKHESEVAWVEDWVEYELERIRQKYESGGYVYNEKEVSDIDKVEKLMRQFNKLAKTNKNVPQIMDIYICFSKNLSFIIEGENDREHIIIMQVIAKNIKAKYKFEIVSLNELKAFYNMKGYEGINEYLYNQQKNNAVFPKNICFRDFNIETDNILTFKYNKYDFINQLIQDRYAIEKNYDVKTYYLTTGLFKEETIDKLDEKTIEILKLNFTKKNIIKW